MERQRRRQDSKMESFATIVNGFQPIIIVAKLSILDVCGGPVYANWGLDEVFFT